MTQTLEIKVGEKTLSTDKRTLNLDESFSHAIKKELPENERAVELKYKNPNVDLDDEAERIYHFLGGETMREGDLVSPCPDYEDYPTVAIVGDYTFTISP